MWMRLSLQREGDLTFPGISSVLCMIETSMRMHSKYKKQRQLNTKFPNSLVKLNFS